MKSSNNHQSFSLVELSIAMAVVAILVSSILPLAIRTVQIKAVEKAAAEMIMIQQACLNYYKDHNYRWPADIRNDLQQTNNAYLDPNWIPKNPWQNDPNVRSDYRIDSTGTPLSIATNVPQQWTKFLAKLLPMGRVEPDTTVKFPIIYQANMNALPVGTIIPWPSSTLPEGGGFLWCDGAIYKIADYPALARTLGSNFMVDANTFKVPDLRGRTIVGLMPSGWQDDGTHTRVLPQNWSQVASIGGVFGEDTHHLTIPELPAHNFYILANDTTTNTGPNHYPEMVAVTSLRPYYTNTVGQDQLHNIVQPSIAMEYIIKY